MIHALDSTSLTNTPTPISGHSDTDTDSDWKSQVLEQGIDGSARKPALRQDTGYMVEKNYLDIAPHLGALGAYVMPQ